MRLPAFLRRLKPPSRFTIPALYVRRIEGESMTPSLRPGQIVLAVGVSAAMVPRPGDVVIIAHGGLEKVKRVARVRSGQVFVVGDNPLASTDSRSFGWLQYSAVVGRVVWPRLGI